MWVLWALLRTCTVAICSTYVHQVGYNLTSVAVSEGLLFMCNLISCTFRCLPVARLSVSQSFMAHLHRKYTITLSTGLPAVPQHLLS